MSTNRGHVSHYLTTAGVSGTAEYRAVEGTELAVCVDIAKRQSHGLAKYGISVEDSPLTLSAWIQHAYEETLDKAIYLKRAHGIIKEIERLHPPLPFDVSSTEVAEQLLDRCVAGTVLYTESGVAELAQLIDSMRAVVGVLPRRSTDKVT